MRATALQAPMSLAPIIPGPEKYTLYEKYELLLIILEIILEEILLFLKKRRLQTG